MTTPPPKARIFLENKPSFTRLVPELAVAIGLNEALVLMQIDIWIGQSDNFEDGHYWTYQSLRDMQEKAFAYMGLATINRAVLSLEEQGLIIVGNYNKRKGDNTRWFAFNLDGLRELVKRVPAITITNMVIQNETPPPPQVGSESQNGSPTDQNGSTLPEIPTENKDQKKKEVVVAPPDPIFHPVFLEVTNDPTPHTPLPALRIVAPVPLELPVIPGDEQRAELIALYQELFPTQLTPGVAANIKDALEEFGFEIVRDSFREAKESKPESFVHWKYIDPIMKRRKAAPPDKPFDHPLWEIYRSYWKQMTSADPIGPDTPYLLKRFSEAVARMEKAGATEADIRALITAKISEERYDYRFDYAATDIVPIITKRKAPRQSAAPGWKPIIVSPASEESMTPEQRAEAVRLGRLQRQQVQRTEAERRRALEGESV